MEGQRPQRLDLDVALNPALRLGETIEAIEQADGPVGEVLRKQNTGEHKVVALLGIGELVVLRQSAFFRPTDGLVDAVLCQKEPRVPPGLGCAG
jgi:hypothetical protein